MAKITKRVKTGLAACPFEKGFESVKFFFFQDLEKKDYIDIIKRYVRKNFNKTEADLILANKDYTMNFFNYAAGCYWKLANLEITDEKYNQAFDRFFNGLIESGKTALKEKLIDSDGTEVKVNVSPAERLKQKVNDTIMQDLNKLEDNWIDKLETTIDVYKLFKEYDLKGVSTSIVGKRIQRWLDDYQAAYDKTDSDLVEGYSHLTRKELKFRIDSCKNMLSDIDKLKATVKPRVAKTLKSKSADRQVSKMNYKVNDSEYKLESVSPIMIVGAKQLYVFNTKTRKLSIYNTSSPNGFEVSGSTIKQYDEKTSITMLLRKPNDILPKLLKTNRQVTLDKTLDEIKVKKAPANGRINIDTIILKVIR